jgi:hypothetical protein
LDRQTADQPNIVERILTAMLRQWSEDQKRLAFESQHCWRCHLDLPSGDRDSLLCAHPMVKDWREKQQAYWRYRTEWWILQQEATLDSLEQKYWEVSHRLK